MLDEARTETITHEAHYRFDEKYRTHALEQIILPVDVGFNNPISDSDEEKTWRLPFWSPARRDALAG